MKLADFPQVLREAWAAHEAFRRIGFRSEDLYLLTDVANIHVQVKAQGKIFTLSVAPRPKTLTTEQIASLWTTLVDGVRSGAITDADLERYWAGSSAKQQGAQLILMLQRKGFELFEHQCKYNKGTANDPEMCGEPIPCPHHGTKGFRLYSNREAN